MLAGVPGLAALIGLSSRRVPSGTARSAVCAILFAGATAVLLWILAPPSYVGLPKAGRGRLNAASAVLAAAAGSAMILSAWHAMGLVLGGALVEELVFRSQLPRAFRSFLAPHLSPMFVNAGSVLLAQLLFSECHFAVRNPMVPFGTGTGYLRLFAAGLFLSIIYEGGLLAAVLLHFAANEMIRTGPLGVFATPSSLTVLVCAMVGVAGVIAMSLVSTPLLHFKDGLNTREKSSTDF